MSGYGWVQEELERLADPGYRTFHEGLIPGVKMSYGVRLPQLRGLAKTILKGGAHISAMPIGFYEGELELIVNHELAAELGIEIPADLMQ